MPVANCKSMSLFLQCIICFSIYRQGSDFAVVRSQNMILQHQSNNKNNQVNHSKTYYKMIKIGGSSPKTQLDKTSNNQRKISFDSNQRVPSRPETAMRRKNICSRALSSKITKLPPAMINAQFKIIAVSDSTGTLQEHP